MSNHQIFISYSSIDADIAKRICEAIEAAGHKCWIAPRDEKAGQSYGLQITNSIKQANAVVLLFSESSNKSQHVLNEVCIAFDQEKKIIPIMLDESIMCEDLQYYLSRVHYIKAYSNLEQGITDLVLSVNQHLSSVEKQDNNAATTNVELTSKLTETLINESTNVSVAIHRFHEIIKDIPNWTKQERILNKAKEIISYSFVGVLGNEFRKIIAISMDNDIHKYQNFCMECNRMVMIVMDLSIFALISHLWDAINSNTISITQEDKEIARKRLNVLYQLSATEQVPMLRSLIEVFQKYEGKIELPIPELKRIVPTLQQNGEVYQACSIISQLPDNNNTMENCIAAENALSTILTNFNFFMRYRMVSLKWSRYEKSRTESTKFLHRYIALGLDNKANMDKEKVNFTDKAITTDSVVMYVDDIGNSNNVNLYPLIIDLNTLHRENGAKICFFYQNPVQENCLEYISLDDFSINTLCNNKIRQKVENLGELYASNEDITTYNIDKVLDSFDQLQSCMSDGMFIDFGDL